MENIIVRFKKLFPEEKNGKFYQNATNADHIIRTPNKNAFSGNIYLLIGPIIPDYNVTQTYEDYLHQKDSQMNFVLNLIK